MSDTKRPMGELENLTGEDLINFTKAHLTEPLKVEIENKAQELIADLIKCNEAYDAFNRGEISDKEYFAILMEYNKNRKITRSINVYLTEFGKKTMEMTKSNICMIKRMYSYSDLLDASTVVKNYIFYYSSTKDDVTYYFTVSVVDGVLQNMSLS
jgi:hypothetical protein